MTMVNTFTAGVLGLLEVAGCSSVSSGTSNGGTGGTSPPQSGIDGGHSAGGGTGPGAGGVSPGVGGAAPGAGGATAGAGGSMQTAGGASAGGGSSGSSAGGSHSSGGGGSTSAGGNGTSFHCPAGPFGSPVPSGATAQRIDGVPPLDAFNGNGVTRTNIEGAVWIADTLYVSEFPLSPTPPDSRVLAIATTSPVAVAVAIPSSGSNGLAVDGSGNLIATNHGLGALVRYSFPLGTPTTLVASYDGKRFNSPNDLAVRSDGNIYFSDPDYQAPKPAPQTQTRLYRVAPGASAATVIDATRSEPNGVTLSADERSLYVSGSDGIESYPVLPDGSVAPGSGVRIAGFSGGSDGLGMDCAGNLYATSSQRIVVLSPSGVEIGSVGVGQAENVTNVAFGGPEHKTLFVTSMGTGDQRGVFRADLNVPGFPY